MRSRSRSTQVRKLVLAIEDAGIDIMHRCGGDAECEACRVQILAGDPPAMEVAEQQRLASEAEFSTNFRLSCQIRVESDLWVVVGQPIQLRPGSRPVFAHWTKHHLSARLSGDVGPHDPEAANVVARVWQLLGLATSGTDVFL